MDIKSPRKVKIGEYYDVPCVKDVNGTFVPIIGPSHSDGPELCIKTTIKHYHYDYRFINNFGPFQGFADNGGEIEYQRLKCVSCVSNNGILLWGILRLMRVYAKHVIDINNPICPHQNIPIVNRNGQCSGHGLCWNLKTGRLKYTPPFYIRFKGSRHKILVTDRENIILVNKSKKTFAPTIVQIIDSVNKIISGYTFEYIDIAPGDTLNINTGCIHNAKNS